MQFKGPLSTNNAIFLCPNYPLGAGCPPLESLSIPFRTRGETLSSPGPPGPTPTMCEQDVISFRCPSCRRELSYRYGMLEPCRNRGHCYVHRSQREETVFTECEGCAQRRRERDHENRRREAERSRRDRSAESQRDAERDRLRKADRRRTHEEREIARAAISMVSRGRREEDLEKEEATPGRWTSNKRKFPK